MTWTKASPQNRAPIARKGALAQMRPPVRTTARRPFSSQRQAKSMDRKACGGHPCFGSAVLAD